MRSAAVVGSSFSAAASGLVAVAGVRGAARMALTDFVESSSEGSTELVGGLLREKVQTGTATSVRLGPHADDRVAQSISQ
jgi:hypothetical protein